MAMSGASAGATFCDINTTPLIDVMLVLLVTLIVTLPVMTHAVKLDMPNPNAPPQPPEVIDLESDYDGTVVWNGTPVASLDQLEGFFHTEAEKDPQPEIHMRPDRRAKYGTVAKVLAAAQHNHMKKIGFVNVAQFSE